MAVVTRLLAVPPMARVVPDGVFDAWSWCESDVLEWRASSFETTTCIDGSNPPGLVFVMREPLDYLPRELASLHAFGYGLQHEYALAPYAIDDATDRLYERRVRPRDVFWMAAPSLAALVWGLHDWVHFHNHGPFDDPATTELQCDLVAMSWLCLNRDVIGIGDAEIARVTRELTALCRRRFEEANMPPPFDIEAAFRAHLPLDARTNGA
jgi:hypothetical protein